jgi:hypothetical protein
MRRKECDNMLSFLELEFQSDLFSWQTTKHSLVQLTDTKLRECFENMQVEKHCMVQDCSATESESR